VDPKDVTRKLSAIFSADVQGYSRLMGDDEIATVEAITEYREIISSLVTQWKGRVVDSPGDNILAEFASVVDAVQCAVEIQNVLKARNEDLPENRRMIFRIGVNLGDVIQEGDRIYGDGVNIAARIESLADGGGICISGTAYDQIENKLALGYNFIGKHSVKNIAKPVRVYKVPMDPKDVGKKKVGKSGKKMAIAAAVLLILAGAAAAIWNFYLPPSPPPMEVASVEKMAFPLPDNPSIAVLPFDNMSGDPDQEFFSNGLTEDIITALSNLPRVFVIARNSSFVYKGKPVKIKQVAEELGVKYVLEGSFRKSGEKVRITAQLIDATTGHHLWADRYDRELKDIFDLQDEITQKILTSLDVKLADGEQARLWRKTTRNPKIYEKWRQALEYFRKFTPGDNHTAREMLKALVALDPEFISGFVLLGWTYLIEVWGGWSKSREKSLGKAVEFAQKALDLDESAAEAHALMGSIHLVKREYDKAVESGKRSVALSPNGADVLQLYAITLGFVGRREEAISLLEKAIRLNPLPPIHYLFGLGGSYSGAGRYEDAIKIYKRALKINPEDFWTNIGLTAAYSLSGRESEAKATAKKILRLNPKFSLEWYEKTLLNKNPADKERMINALRKAGLPENPPLPLPDKPSIAVLPFVNMSGDTEQEYFSDGLTEDTITALSKTPKLFVIARNSTFSYKGKPVKVQKAARELGVRYILEGSVRKSGDRVRITAQLVDTITGNHLWAERYDRDLKDIFAVQDDITKRIIIALQVKLTEGEQARLSGKGTDNLEAYLKTLQAREQFYRMNRQGSTRARELAKEAIEIDPAYATPYVILALTHMMDSWFKFTESPKESIRLAHEATQKALALDSSDPGTYVGLCMLYIMQRQHDKGIEAGKRAVTLSPSGASAHSSLATALNYAGRHEEAIVFHKKAISLNPFPPSIYLRNIGSAYRMSGRYEEAIVEYRKSLQKSPDDLFTHLGLTICYVSLGREKEARAEAVEVLRIHPEFSLEHFAETLPYKNQSDIDYAIASLRKAGLK